MARRINRRQRPVPLDERVSPPYLAFMAKRLLLTLLALLGLAAQVAPAQARVCARAASALVLAAEEDGAAVAVAGAPVRAVPAPSRRFAEAAPLTATASALVPVLIGIDRARE